MVSLFIVESPGKISKISGFLGSNYMVKASVGHFRDLNPKNMSIDFQNNYEPIYIITKPDVVKNLKKVAQKASKIYLATDMDLEGHAIAQHLYDVLRPKNYARITFNAITKSAILDAIKKGGTIDKNMVAAQKARRILDRIYGYTVSSQVSSWLGSGLTAGRVQSVAVRLVIDKETEIKNFLSRHSNSSYFHVRGEFKTKREELNAVLQLRTGEDNDLYVGKLAQISLVDDPDSDGYDTIRVFLNRCRKSKFTIRSINKTESNRNPPPPFETATLQQEANRKFRMSVDTTMKTAQKLYEAGYITYMRTDSTTIAPDAHKKIRKVIIDLYGKEYYKRQDHSNKSSNSQDAHEAIRPTDPSLQNIQDSISDNLQIKLYKLIWQRTIASQMQPAKIAITTIQIDISRWLKYDYDPFYYFQTKYEQIIFDGFMKVYVESTDESFEADPDIALTKKSFKLPKVGERITMQTIVAKQEYKKPPVRYTEASMVKTLKKLGIGRPSTYVNTIKTIMMRNYVKLGDVDGVKKKIHVLTIQNKNKKIKERSETCIIGKDMGKILPTDLGESVNSFLIENFSEMLDYKFTAKMESQLDSISNGKVIWHKVVRKFHDKLEELVKKLGEKQKTLNGGSNDNNSSKNQGTNRCIGKFEGNDVFIGRTKYGPVVWREINGKKIYTKLEPGCDPSKVTLEQVGALLSYPKTLGKYKNGDVILYKGKFGFYIRYLDNNYSLKTKDEPDLKTAIKEIESKNSQIIQTFEVIIRKKKVAATVYKGVYGPYIRTVFGNKGVNHTIPRHIKISELDEKQVLSIIQNSRSNTRKKSGSKTQARRPKASNKK